MNKRISSLSLERSQGCSLNPVRWLIADCFNTVALLSFCFILQIKGKIFEYQERGVLNTRPLYKTYVFCHENQRCFQLLNYLAGIQTNRKKDSCHGSSLSKFGDWGDSRVDPGLEKERILVDPRNLQATGMEPLFRLSVLTFTILFTE